MTVTITRTRIEGTGLYQGVSGYVTATASWKTSARERGYLWYPQDLRTVYNDPASLLTYDAWMSQLASAGVSMVCLRLTGRNTDDDGGACGFEPPPYGTFNIWHSVLDPSNLAVYRSDQVTHPVADPPLSNSNLYQLINAAETHGVGLWVTFFDFMELTGAYWSTHAYNSNNFYIDGNPCAGADQGMIANRTDFFTDAGAIAAAKARIQFFLDAFGSSHAVKVFELFNEMTWLADADWWGEPMWNAQMVTNVRTKMVPWVSEIANYIRDNDTTLLRFIANSNAFPRTSTGDWPADPDHYRNVIAELYSVYPLDIVGGRGYENGNFNRYITEVEMLQEKYGPRMICIGEYWPFEHDGVNPVNEPAPHLDSRMYQWLPATCAWYGFAALRWQGLEESAGNVWIRGGYGDPDMADIAGVTATFNSYVAWNSFAGGSIKDSDISTPQGTVFDPKGWGNSTHVTFMVRWSSSGSKLLTFTGLTNGNYNLYLFNWEDGTLDTTLYPTAVGGTFSILYTMSLTRNILVGYLEPT